MCDCKVGPGKFEGEGVLTYLAWLEGCSDETTGDSERGNLTDWTQRPFGWDEGEFAAARAYGYCDACIREAQDSPTAGIALWESEQGFVYGTTYDTLDEYESALAEAQAEDEASAEEEE